MDERRKEPRVPLDCPVFATLRFGDGEQVFCLLQDVSESGARIALPPGEPVERIAVGGYVEFTEPSVSYDEAAVPAAEIVWTDGSVFGVRFANDAEVNRLLLAALLAGI